LDRRELGRRGEEAVARLLARRGFDILARNVRVGRGELDVVAERAGTWWFVECKCRGRADVGSPARALDRRKRASLYRAAREFVVRRGFRGEWGFLAASVVWEPDGIDASRTTPPRIELARLSIGPESLERG